MFGSCPVIHTAVPIYGNFLSYIAFNKNSATLILGIVPEPSSIMKVFLRLSSVNPLGRIIVKSKSLPIPSSLRNNAS